MAIKPGTKAPHFNLFNTQKQAVDLNSLQGKNVVLHFFPAAFTGVCTAQMCSTRDDISFYNNLNAEVFGVSVDMPFSLQVFKDNQNINFELLSDFNKTLIKDYDMYQENFAFGMKGVAKRGVVVIDKEGTVRYSEETENPGVQVNFDALKAALQAL